MSSNNGRIIIGCPIFQRQWIIDRWLEHAAIAVSGTGLEFAFLFVGDPDTDPTFEVINKFSKDFRVPCYVREFTEKGVDQLHKWTVPRFKKMVTLRNLLLQEVRSVAPEYFLSLDSDILLHRDALKNMVESTERFNAVGGRAYLTSRHRTAPTYANKKKNGQYHRKDFEGVTPVDVIMAVKLMTQPAYEVDYEYHHKGEDFGWSISAKTKNISLGWDGRVISKHIMYQDLLDKVDDRVGW